MINIELIPTKDNFVRFTGPNEKLYPGEFQIFENHLGQKYIIMLNGTFLYINI